jgi:hypothetical protein
MVSVSRIFVIKTRLRFNIQALSLSPFSLSLSLAEARYILLSTSSFSYFRINLSYRDQSSFEIATRHRSIIGSNELEESIIQET